MLIDLRRAGIALTVTGALGLGACASDDEKKKGEAGEKTATRAEAVRQIAPVRSALDRGLAAVRAGKRKKADEILSEGYVKHFEEVEGPLEKVDAKLKEELEEALSTKLRQRIRQNASPRQVARLVRDIKGDLATAEKKLK